MADTRPSLSKMQFGAMLERSAQICNDNPEMFDEARRAMSQWHNGEITLIAAMTNAIARAHEAGRTQKSFSRLSEEEEARIHHLERNGMYPKILPSKAEKAKIAPEEKVEENRPSLRRGRTRIQPVTAIAAPRRVSRSR